MFSLSEPGSLCTFIKEPSPQLYCVFSHPNRTGGIISEASTKTTGRAILQLTDDMTLIKRYDTIAQAVRETGVNSKSIRDAAKGVQKHAGGYVWKYVNEE